MEHSESSRGKATGQKSKPIVNTISILFGKHSAKGATCLESAIDNLVARVQLDRLHQSEMWGNRRKNIQSSTMPLKRKLPPSIEKGSKKSRLNNKIIEKKIEREKIGTNVNRLNMKVKTKPLKNNTLPSQSNPINLSNNKSILNKSKVKLNDHTKPRLKSRQHFNGDKHQIIFSGPRVRKPNPKFQDFITTPQVRSTSDRQPKERSETSTIKQKPKPVKTIPVKAAEEDPLNLVATDVSTEPPPDDVVRSFLPVIDKPDVLYDSGSDMDLSEALAKRNNLRSKNKVEDTLSKLSSNGKENEIKQVSVLKSNAQSNKDKNNLILKSTEQKQLTPNSPLILAPHSVTPVIISPKLVNANAMPIIIATNLIPSLAKDISLPILQNISGKEIVTTKSNEIHNNNEKKMLSQQRKEALSQQKKESSNKQKKEMINQQKESPKLQKKESPNMHKNGTPSLQKKEMPSPLKKETPSSQKKENPSQQKETFSSRKGEALSPQKKETRSPQKKEKPNEQMNEMPIGGVEGTSIEQNIVLSVPQKNETMIPIKKRGRRKIVALEVTKKKSDVRYCLVETEGALSKSKTPKGIDVDFNKLVRTLKSVKLPAPNWKIRIVVSRQQTITEVTFTNKEVNERCVKFSRIFTGYVITIGKSVVKLIGAPHKISTFNDVTILLNIVHNLSLNDPILQYISDKDVGKNK